MKAPKVSLIIIMALSASLWASPGPRLTVDYPSPGPMRICSRHYCIRIPVRNSGDKPLTITQVRQSCGCCTTAFLTRQEMGPGDSGYLIVMGRIFDFPESSDLSFFIRSND